MNVQVIYNSGFFFFFYAIIGVPIYWARLIPSDLDESRINSPAAPDLQPPSASHDSKPTELPRGVNQGQIGDHTIHDHHMHKISQIQGEIQASYIYNRRICYFPFLTDNQSRGQRT